MEYLVAVILGLVVAGFAATSGFDRDRAFYPTVLIVVGVLLPVVCCDGCVPLRDVGD